MTRIHSAVRWDKPEAEIVEIVRDVGVSMSDALAAQDPKNGNRCLHIAAQNGHMQLVKFLVQQKADVNARNSNGQTALHMSVEYDFYFQSVMLIENGADPALTNNEGHAAVKGIEGTKEGADAWDSPVTILKAARDKAEIDIAFAKLEAADPSALDKAALVQAGMSKKRAYKDIWDAARFMELVRRL